ncbi:GspH/FimT family pseudopilin [Ampullimonas aquatilis]|uniref:GspH/FimT family pseudopilin n=1 Tax=Ampullimonas aquatilis TaxID=1341549 RepID=UPI003C716206
MSKPIPTVLQRYRSRGFTLIELMIVVVIMGIILGVVGVRAFPGGEQQLRTEAERLAQLFSAARDEARLRGAPIAWQADRISYRFMALAQYNDLSSWTQINGDDILKPRNWMGGLPLTGTFIQPGRPAQQYANPNPETLMIVFGREPIDAPFVLSLTREDLPGKRVQIEADGLGHFVVKTGSAAP